MLEFGAAQVRYTYEHKEYDPVTVKVNSPIFSAGYGGRFDKRWHGGFILFPAKMGSQRIPGLPRRVSDQTVPINVTTTDTVLHTGFGAAYRFSSKLSAGGSLVWTYEKHKIDADMSANELGLFDLDGTGNFIRPVIGMRYDDNSFTVTTALQGEVKKKYSGKQKTSTATDSTAPKLKDYQPYTIGLGASWRKDIFRIGTTINYGMWSKGKDSVTSGINVIDADADLKDTLDYALHFDYIHSRLWTFQTSYARVFSPWGEGFYDQENLAATQSGVEFGQLNGVDKHVVGAGVQSGIVKNSNLSLALYYATGSREVSENAYSSGHYKLNVLSLSSGITLRI
jgi:hypothetical protein